MVVTRNFKLFDQWPNALSDLRLTHGIIIAGRLKQKGQEMSESTD